jgi:hypothetical protein
MEITTSVDGAIQNPSDASRSQPQEISVDILETAHIFEGQIRAHSGAFTISIDNDSCRRSPEPDVPRSVRDSTYMV